MSALARAPQEGEVPAIAHDDLDVRKPPDVLQERPHGRPDHLLGNKHRRARGEPAPDGLEQLLV